MPDVPKRSLMKPMPTNSSDSNIPMTTHFRYVSLMLVLSHT